MERSGLEKKETQSDSASLQCSVHDGILTIGQTSTPLYQAGNQAKVPDVVFYDNPQHIRILESLLQDFLLGDHLLLVGNQGVGKNRLIDRLLALMNRPREYIQSGYDCSESHGPAHGPQRNCHVPGLSVGPCCARWKHFGGG